MENKERVPGGYVWLLGWDNAAARVHPVQFRLDEFSMIEWRQLWHISCRYNEPEDVFSSLADAQEAARAAVELELREDHVGADWRVGLPDWVGRKWVGKNG